MALSILRPKQKSHSVQTTVNMRFLVQGCLENILQLTVGFLLYCPNPELLALSPHPETQLWVPLWDFPSCLVPGQVSPAHVCLTSSADLALDFGSRSPPSQFLVLRSMICCSLDFHSPVSMSTAGGLSHLHVLLRPPNHTGAPGPPSHPDGKVVIGRKLGLSRGPCPSCSPPCPSHPGQCLLAHSSPRYIFTE